MTKYVKLIVAAAFCFILVNPGAVVFGSTTSEVESTSVYRLQKMLVQDALLYPNGEVTGILNSETIKAVKKLNELIKAVEKEIASGRSSASKLNIDDQIKYTISGLRAAAEIHYDYSTPRAYSGFCKSNYVNTAKSELKKIKASELTCKESPDGYRVFATLKSEKKYFCIDSRGSALSLSRKPNTDTLTCE